MSGRLTRYVIQASALLLLVCTLPASAAIVINNTRVVYPQNEREVTVRIDNQGKGPVLLQTWIDDGDAQALPEKMQVPFVLTPPVNRIDAGKSQSVRIRYTGRSLPSDRESLFWLNALEIPARQKSADPQNLLQMAFRTRIKLFFRPAELQGEPEAAAQTLQWESGAGQVTAVNDTPWHVSLLSVHVQAEGKTQTIEGDTVAPFSRQDFAVTSHGRIQVMGWQYINDYGAIQDMKASR
ncbi:MULTISPECIES: fimbria/pilus periplasmic chaperone [unclassified Vibrio]|uniref:fimbria/pilus periplasmic chaperone n=1 Tax=unclassified Vibrio TaxID=2614977 RepID=UPI0013613AAF|nr:MULTISPECIES: fimbria/pilus periplasmic chaperone [unclassified Vibrio]NAW60125.1 fimbria/pilus periplasmic chaperone [Vibrio sp. V36_P2S2PM302]NAX27580.1 fimbria/pilus periplasmic chaperone [Vibrio sp. V38_P2S17PM301]NAX31130.1 fimbria/pilus periplasmic chaperone [Vibrio sp. V37_P2S8PM304]